MTFFGKYQKTYSKKNPSNPLKYNESLFRNAIEASCFENGLGENGSTSNSLNTSGWKNEFDKLIPEK